MSDDRLECIRVGTWLVTEYFERLDQARERLGGDSELLRSTELTLRAKWLPYAEGILAGDDAD